VTSFRLARIDQAEQAVRELLYRHRLHSTDLRVRDLGEVVRVEVDASLGEAVSELPGLTEVIRKAGFADHRIEVASYRYGALNHSD
jgi:uncharacterized protein